MTDAGAGGSRRATTGGDEGGAESGGGPESGGGAESEDGADGITRRSAIEAIGAGALLAGGSGAAEAQSSSLRFADPNCPADGSFPFGLRVVCRSHDGRWRHTDPILDPGETIAFGAHVENGSAVEGVSWRYVNLTSDLTRDGGSGDTASESFAVPGIWWAYARLHVASRGVSSRFFGFYVSTPAVTVVRSPSEPVTAGSSGQFAGYIDPSGSVAPGRFADWTWTFTHADHDEPTLTASGAGVEPTFTLPGEYTATVTAAFDAGDRRSASTTFTVAPAPGPVPTVDGVTPTDPDADGVYESLNGNDRVDVDDVVEYFDHLDDAAMADHPEYFDVNGNGRLEFDDVVALFESI